MKLRFFVSLLMFLGAVTFASAQTISVKGTVID